MSQVEYNEIPMIRSHIYEYEVRPHFLEFEKAKFLKKYSQNQGECFMAKMDTIVRTELR